MDGDFHRGGGLADCWEEGGSLQPGRELLEGITCSLSQVKRGCCMVGAPQI